MLRFHLKVKGRFFNKEEMGGAAVAAEQLAGEASGLALVPSCNPSELVPWAAYFTSLSYRLGMSQCLVPGWAWVAAWAPPLPCSKDSMSRMNER